MCSGHVMLCCRLGNTALCADVGLLKLYYATETTQLVVADEQHDGAAAQHSRDSQNGSETSTGAQDVLYAAVRLLKLYFHMCSLQMGKMIALQVDAAGPVRIALKPPQRLRMHCTLL